MPACAHRRGGLAAQQEALRQLGEGLLIALDAVIVARHIGHLGKPAGQVGIGLVHAAGHGASGVQLVAQGYQFLVSLGTLGLPLLGYLVAHAPHHDAGVVAVVLNQVGDVTLPPLVPQAVIAVLDLGIAPCVETLGHHHHAHRVAHLHLPGRGHVVAGADGIGTHLLEQAYLADESGLVEGGP